MHETRNFVLTMVLMALLAWAIFAWLVAPAFLPSLTIGAWQKIASVVLASGFGVWLYWIYHFTDRFDDQLARVTGGQYYEHDGLCFMPLVRTNGKRAEISLYYQNRHANPVEAVIHLRPPRGAFATHANASDVAIAFQARAGAFGVVHQPIAVAPDVQGQVVEVQLAAATRWPRSHGEELRSHQGMSCGTFRVDWALAYRVSEYELSGEIELQNPATLHLAMPSGVSSMFPKSQDRSQEMISCAKQ